MKIIDAFLPVFDYMEKLVPELVEQSDKTINDVQKDLESLLKLAADLPYAKDKIDLALFAVCTFIDEKILESYWKERDAWSKSPLQKIHFDTNIAGELFFHKLDNLNENVEVEQQVREVYLYCLVQGFSGCYFSAGEQSFLQDLIQNNYALLTKEPSSSLFISHESIPRTTSSNEQLPFHLKELFTIWGPIIFVIIIYMFLRNDLLSTITSALMQI